MKADHDKLADEIYESLKGALPKKPLVVPETPAPRVVAREVRVNPDDPNYNAANKGRVQVGIYEVAYWNKVDRVFNPPLFSEVVSAYDPFAPERMPGFDEGDR